VSALVSASSRRRYPSTFGGLIYLAVVVTTAVGLAMVAFGPWRRGIALVGFALIFAAGMRMVTPEDEAGMLRVRSRWFDVTVLAGVGVSLVALSANIPDQTVA
jgi:predicted cobalt transporter CbtA